MILEEQLRVVILAVPEVVALVEGRLSPIYLRPGIALPAGTYRRVSTRYVSTLEDNEVTEFPTIEIIFWGFDYLALKTASEAVKARVWTSTLFAHEWDAEILAEEDVFDNQFQHQDGIGVPGVRIECGFAKLR